MPNTNDHTFQDTSQDTSAPADASCDQTTHSDELDTINCSAQTGSELIILAPMPNFVPPLEGEAAMLNDLLGDAFFALIKRN
jgi:hypothetical protein